MFGDSMKEYRSEIFKICDEYVDAELRLSPIASTYAGDHSQDDKLDDYSLESDEINKALALLTFKRLSETEPMDEHDERAKYILMDDLVSVIYFLNSKHGHALWGVIDSAVSEIRDVFEMMPCETDKDMENITKRMLAIPRAYGQWLSTIESVSIDGHKTPLRHVLGVANQLLEYSYEDLAKRFDPELKYLEMHDAAKDADIANKFMSEWLVNSYAPHTITKDAVGEDKYLVWAQEYTYDDINLRETYESGVAELAEINSRMWELAKEIAPNAQSLREVADELDKNENYLIRGTEALLETLRDFTDKAVKELDGVHFDIDERIKFCDVKLAPEGGDSAPYYVDPSEDLTRPGTSWYPTMGKTEFSFWINASTWYHEAVPGHHLQIGTQVTQQEFLSRYQRNGAWNSGYGEGWALYSERLMYELGFFTDPGYEMGYLANQALRAARLVVDIGMHLEYVDEEDGQVWTAEKAYDLLTNKAMINPTEAKSEVDRYLCWPGQAISYKVGERVWLKCREDAKERLGDKFSLKKFHAYALKLGPMSLEFLITELDKWDGE